MPATSYLNGKLGRPAPVPPVAASAAGSRSGGNYSSSAISLHEGVGGSDGGVYVVVMSWLVLLAVLLS
jgi:hypothetical protein